MPSAPDESAVRAVGVTGVGLLTPLGEDLPALAAALNAGRSSVRVREDGRMRSLIAEFDARKYANVRGMRVYARNTQLQICAAQLALNNAGLALDKLDPLQFGLVSGASFSHLETLLEYDRSLVSVGMQRTNPTLMPLGLHSAPGALTALSFGAKAFAITLSDGGGSGASALGLGARLVRNGRARVCLVTAAFTDCAELSLAAAQGGMLADEHGFRVFDRQSRGTAFGELAVAAILEPVEQARERGRELLGFVRGEASVFSSDDASNERALGRACRWALERSGRTPHELALVCSGANGGPASDRAEARALLELLAGEQTRACVTAPKSSLGESFDASGLLQSVLALEALRSRVAAPIVGLAEPSVGGLRYATRATELGPGCALVTSISHSGACSALTLSVEP